VVASECKTRTSRIYLHQHGLFSSRLRQRDVTAVVLEATPDPILAISTHSMREILGKRHIE
jgi:hypothetical protein